jgi:LytS/YehU family sensor histidine kinase
LYKLEQENKFMKLEQMALRAQMNPHFIFNCIAVMQQLVAEGDKTGTQKFITSFSNLVRQTLDNATELFIPLDEEIKFLVNYFELERIRLEDRFTYVVDASAIGNPEEIKVPNMVIQPFAENAIRHGIRYKKDGQGHITVLFTQPDGRLRCTITDNGIGRARAEEIKKAIGINHQSKSTGITFKRIESLKVLTGNDISIAIDDLHDENAVALGTRVNIDF